LTYETITSPSNPRVKAAAALRDARDRKRTQRILIDGSDLIARAIDGGWMLEELLIAEAALVAEAFPQPQRLHDLLRRAPGVPVLALGPMAMKKLQYGDREVDAIAIAKMPATELDSRLATLALPKRALFLVLDRIEKPGNLGAMLRTADAAGVTAVLASDPVCEIWNPNAIRSSLGAIFRVPIAVGTEDKIDAWLREHEVTVYAARVEGAVDYAAVRYPERAAVVIGSEAMGLQGRWSGPHVAPILIPMHGTIDSLNASVSSAILLFEMVRQMSHP
jgi:RNA methyltransferase, TrmH family